MNFSGSIHQPVYVYKGRKKRPTVKFRWLRWDSIFVNCLFLVWGRAPLSFCHVWTFSCLLLCLAVYTWSHNAQELFFSTGLIVDKQECKSQEPQNGFDVPKTEEMAGGEEWAFRGIWLVWCWWCWCGKTQQWYLLNVMPFRWSFLSSADFFFMRSCSV